MEDYNVLLTMNIKKEEGNLSPTILLEKKNTSYNSP